MSEKIKKGYILVDKNTGVVEQVIHWGDNRDLPEGYSIEEGKEIINVDLNTTMVDYTYVYNFDTETFSKNENFSVPKPILPSIEDRITALENAQLLNLGV